KGPCDLKATCPEHGVLAFHGLAGGPCVDGTAISSADTAFVTQPNAMLQLKEGEALLELRLSYLDQDNAIKLCIAD
ncbi:MAG: HutD family protein, partial [Pacificibacter sp.]